MNELQCLRELVAWFRAGLGTGGGGGGGTFPATPNLIKGTGVANVGADSLIDPSDVVYGNIGALVNGNLLKWEGSGVSDSGIVASTASQGITNGAAVGTATGLILSNGANSISGVTDLPNGTTATTQSAADASTKIATTAYADTGDAAVAAASATAAQGAKADSALQPTGDGSGLTSLTASNITAGELADGMTAVTQAEGSGDTQLATNQYVDRVGVSADTGWTANADAGDKTAVIGSAATLAAIATALDLETAGAGTQLAAIAAKVKALEDALANQLRPNA